MEDGGWRMEKNCPSILYPPSSILACILSRQAIVQKRWQGFGQGFVGDERVQLGVQGAAGLVEVFGMALLVFEITLAEEGGLAEAGGFALEASEAAPGFERELDLVAVQDAQRDHLVAVVAEVGE